MGFELAGIAFRTIGELLVAATVLRVHAQVVEDKKLDGNVFKEMKIEQRLGIIGAFCIALGFLLELPRFF